MQRRVFGGRDDRGDLGRGAFAHRLQQPIRRGIEDGGVGRLRQREQVVVERQAGGVAAAAAELDAGDEVGPGLAHRGDLGGGVAPGRVEHHDAAREAVEERCGRHGG
jgi:hypothetical protein